MTLLNGLVTLQYLYTGGDEVSHYATLHTTLVPLKQYLDAILATNEWGDVYVRGKNLHIKLQYYKGNYVAEYCKNINVRLEEDCVYTYMPGFSHIAEFLDTIVKKVSYEGGWSRGNWFIDIIDN